MKIGFVLDDTLDKPDGVQQYVLMLGGWLSSQGHEVHYLVTDTERTDIPNVHSMGGYLSGRFNGNHVRTPFPVRRERVQSLLAKLELDVIHIQMPYSPFFGGRVVMAANRVPLVATFHILPYTRWQRTTNYLLGKLQHRSIIKLAQVIAPTPAATAFAESAYAVRTVTMPHPIDLEHFQSGKPLERYTDGKINILFLGRLVARKGVLALIRAYLRLDPELRGQCRLIIAGAGPQMNDAVRLANAANDIVFEGYIDEAAKPDYLATADLAIFPAQGGESFGIVLTEAMAARSGVVLGGDNPGYSGVLEPFPECLFEPNDIPGLVSRLRVLISDASLRKALHERQQLYVQGFDLNAYGQRIVALYTSAIHTN